MTRPLDKHLDGDELDGLVSSHAASVTDSGRLSEQTLGEAQRHVESCQDCSRKVQMHKSVQSEISYVGVIGDAPPGPDCIADVDWVNVAAGLLPEAKTRDLVKHAAQCGHCGPLLKSAAEMLADEVTTSEETLLATLSSASPKWQRNMASMLRSNVQEGQQKPSWWREIFVWPTPTHAFAGIAAVAILVWIGVRTLRPPSTEQLLARAYTEHRTLEVRIPGAKYAPMRVERSGDGSNLDKPEPLLKAEALISEHLRKTPSDPTWLQAKARADLLDGSYDDAIKMLQRALGSQPDSAQLLADIGSAYFLRAKSINQAIDYGRAVEFLGKALAKTPDDPIALFNRALACEQMFLYTQAVDDWEHYLRVDPQSEWADEARKRLASVQQKLQQHEHSQAEPLLTPEEIAKADANAGAIRVAIDGRIEEYQHVAITEWLPKAYPASVSETPSNELTAALLIVAAVLRDQHGDYWLTDLLDHSSDANFSSGLRALSASVSADDRGDYSSAYSSAHVSAQLFRAASSLAGEIRAQAEEVYSDHLLWEGKRCIALLHRMNGPLRRSNYGWIAAQMSLEESNCANLVGDLGTYRSAITAGVSEARKHGYTSLFLRGRGFEALSAAALGNAKQSFSIAVQSLAFFWRGHVDLTKGYNLYTDLDAAADGLGLPYLQVSIWREATALLDPDPDVLKRAMAHRWYGNAAYLANMSAVAALEFSKASALLAASPKTAATTRDRLDAEVWLANVEVRQGDVERAAGRLEAIRPNLYSAPSFDPEIGYYSVQAAIAMRRTDPIATESALRSAVFLAEWALKSLPAEGDRRQWAEQTRYAYRDAVEWKLRQGDAISALEVWEWYRGAEFRASEDPSLRPPGNVGIDTPPNPRVAPPLPSPAVVTNGLSLLHDKTVIVYATFSDGIAVWAYDDRGAFNHWIATPVPPLQDLTTRFHQLCSDPSSDLAALRTTAHSIYDVLVKPIEGRLEQGRTLLFEPDDFLATIPWDALVDDTGHYLAERFATVISPGFYRTMHLRPTAAITRETPVLIVSVPIVPGLAPLGDAEDEAQAVASMFSTPRFLQGSNATLSAIRKELRGSAVFHFAGHAIASSQFNGLVLSELDPITQGPRLVGGGSFTARETDGLQLAVLSACNTEGEALIGSPGTEVLAQALLRARVPHVIASRWKIDSTETAVFMGRLYAALLAGNNVANSVHIAERALASQANSAHPYFWCAFELQGIT